MSIYELNNQFDDWSCSMKNGLIEENYQDDDIFFNHHNLEDHNSYNLLCTFDYNIVFASELYTLHILFPNCQFSSENELIAIQLTNSSSLIGNHKYQINFSQEGEGITAADINYDQNMKTAFFVNLISNDFMQLNIDGTHNLGIALAGLQKGMSSPLCT